MSEINQSIEQVLEKRNAEFAKMLAEEQESKRKAELAAMGFRPDFKNWTFENYELDFKNAAAFEACVKFSRKPFNMFIYGTPGNGKSRLSWAAGLKYKQECAAAGKHISMLFLPIAEFNAKAIEAKKTNSKDFIRNLMRKDILILDDLGSEELSKSGTDTLTELLNQWLWAKKKGLIIPCNYSIKELAVFFNNDRIPSRISGVMDLFVENLAEDYRVKGLRDKTLKSGQDFNIKAAELGLEE